MRLINLFLLFIFIGIQHIHGQVNNRGNIDKLETLADSLFKVFKYKNSSTYYLQAANWYERKQDWLKCTRNYRKASYALIKSTQPDSALYLIQKAIAIIEAHVSENKNMLVEKTFLLIDNALLAEKKWDFKEEMKTCWSAYREAIKADSLLLITNVWNELAAAHRNQLRYDSAIYYCKKSIETRTKVLGNDNLDVAECFYNLGKIFDNTSNLDSALKYYQKSMQIRVLLLKNQHPDIASCLNGLGNVYYNKGEFDMAFEYFQKATQMKINLFGENYPDVALGYNNYGLVYYSKGDLNKSLDYFNKAFQILNKTIGIENPTAAITYNGYGIIYEKKGEYNKALEYLEKSLRIRMSIYGEQHPDVAAIYNNMGIIYCRKGAYDKSLLFNQKALTIRSAVFGEKSPYVIQSYSALGEIYDAIGDRTQSLYYYEKALNMATAIFGEQNLRVAMYSNNLGMVYNNMHNYTKSIFYYEKALYGKIAVLGEKNQSVATTYSNIGNVYLSLGDYAKVFEYYNKAITILREVVGPKHPSLARCYNNLGVAFIKKGDYSKALEYIQEAIISNTFEFVDTCIYHNPQPENILSKPLLLNTLTAKATAFLYRFENLNLQKDLESSLLAYELKINLVNRMRKEYNATESQISQDNQDDFIEVVRENLLLDKFFHIEGAKQRAFEFMERGKSAALAFQLNQCNAAHFGGIPDYLIDTEKKIRKKISDLDTKINKEKYKKGGYDTISLNAYENENFSYHQKLDSLINSFEKNYPQYYLLKYSNNLSTIDEIKKNLDNQTALLNYFVGDSSLFIAVITDSLFDLQEVKIDSTLNRSVITYYKNIKKVETESFVPNSVYIFNKLIKPIKHLLNNKKRLIIIPDEYLYYLPFETLLSEGNSPNPDFSQLNYLLKTFGVSYHYSATLWLNSVKKSIIKSMQPESAFVGFAPVFSSGENNGVILASNFPAIDTTEENLAYRSISADLKKFNPLPYSKEEVTTIFQLFERRKKKAKVYLYSEANEYNFKHRTGTYNFVHISSHGFSNDKVPNLSGIVFSQPKDTASGIVPDQKEDGILYSGEAYNLSLNTDLVVLSSCESGLGKLKKGEGLQALPRGFIYAGTPNIIFSLWKALDKPTKDIMVNFYSNVLDGKSYTDALRTSKLALMQNPKTAFPHFWSGFVLVGR